MINTTHFKLISYSFFYSLIGILLYAITDGQPFQTLSAVGFDKVLNFIIQSEEINKIRHYLEKADKQFFFFYFAIYFLFIIIILFYNFNKILLSKNKLFNFNNVEFKMNLNNKSKLYFYIALAAGLGLFLELAIIRIHSSYFQLFAYFKNISLLSCFLGLGIGFSLSNKKLKSLAWVFPFFAAQIIFLYLLKNTPITAFLQNPISEQWAMGQSIAKGIYHLSIIYGFLILIFIFNAMCFVPIGHLVTKLMSHTDSLRAYGYNLIGSIAGVLLFTLLSFFWTPPIIWLSFGFILYLFFAYFSNLPKMLSTLSFLFTIILIGVVDKADLKNQEFYSPYQNISIEHTSKLGMPLLIKSSHIWFQTPLNLSEGFFQEKNKDWFNFYNFPFDISDKKPEKIMIVGSGSGNDVAAAIRNKIKKIDAVEIDPVIGKLGLQFHPEKPYSADNVNFIINDARNAIKYAKEKYDLILYSVLDSHSNLSGKGGIRLDSFVYTEESFKEAKQKLNSNGYLVLSFAISTQELGIKIFNMLKTAFDGKKPIVLSISQDVDNFVDQKYIFVISENLNQFTKIQKTTFYKTNIFDNSEMSKNIDVSTDDWPFFYMVKKVYPISYLVVILLIFASSYFFVKKTNNLNFKNFSPTCFFLGAGFMLVETKGITEAAKIFGGTWIVISVIILLILTMAFFANLLIYKKVRIKENYIYLLLFLSIVVSYYATNLRIEDYSLITAKILNPIFLTLPLFFSGLAFSNELKKLNSPSIALSSNILGALFGGLLEYNSMYFGFKFLYLLAVIVYLLSYLYSGKKSFNFR
jgi:hypothetical protein